MSRIGRKLITVPSGVEIKLEGRKLTAKGPKGTLSRTVPEGIEIVKEDGSLKIISKLEGHSGDAQHGLWRAVINSAVKGVSVGFQMVLELSGVGYRAAKQGKALSLQLGFSHPVVFDPPDGIEFDVDKQVKIVIKGIDKQLVGQVAAAIREMREVEPYKAKGIKYEGEVVRRKAGKAAKSATA